MKTQGKRDQIGAKIKSRYRFIRDANWREAMAKEIEALELNDTWIIVDLPRGPINCRWVYKVKYHADGSLE